MNTSTAETTSNTTGYTDRRAIVGRIYQLFGKGDVPAILEHVSEDAQWDHWKENSAQAKGVPYLQARNGKKGAAAFLASLAAVELRKFEVGSILGGGDKVCAEIVIEFEVKATGKILRDEQLHLWTFDARDQVVAFRHYLDTAKHIDANTP